MELEAVFERLAAAVDRLRAEETSTGVLGRLAPEARRLAGADLAAVLLRAEPSRGWAPVSWDPNGAAGSTPISGATRFPSAPGTLVEAVLRSKQAIWEASLAGAGADDRDLGAALGLGSVALLPVHCEGVICAILALGWGAPGHAPAPGSEPGSPPVLVPGLAEALAGYAGMAIENAALRGELEHGGLRAELSARAEGSEALHRVAADVAGRSDPEEIADDALGALLGLYQADAGVFNLLDEGSRISSFVHAGLSEEELLQLTAIFSEGRGGRGRDVQTQVFQLTATERRRPLRRFFAEHGFASLVRVSAVSQGRVIGRLILLHREVRQYRLDELAQLEAFAVQLAGGLRLAKAYSDLESVDRQREEFLAFIAHEVRHPVAAISTIAETLADTPGLGAREQRALDGLRGQARLLTRLAEEVLAVARVETQGVRPRRSEVDVGALLDALGRQAPDPERVHLARPSRRVRIEADPELLGHAFDNLMRNALKYSPPGSPVGISLSSARGSLRIAVRDHGVGLAPDEIPRLFKKYGRIHNDRTAQTAGVGLGLYLSRLLIEAHGGSITAESAGLGEGSTFTVVLPNEPANPDVRP